MKLISAANKLNKVFSRPISRTYARYFIGDKPADPFLRFLCSLQFWTVHEFWPNFLNPERFSEKLWNRLLHERDPLFTLINDKLKVRNFISECVGSELLIPLLWTGNSPEKIPFDDLPSRFVIKTNHGAGYNIIVNDKSELNREETKEQLKKWLCENYCQDKYLGIEWGYKNIVPTIIIESFLEENMKTLVDYKFWCFSGRVELITVHFDRFEKPRTKTLDRNFEPHEYEFPLNDNSFDFEPPENYTKMLKISESLAKNFEFIRVDLYNVFGKIYFSELTLHPGGAGMMFLKAEQDRILGDKWKLS